jgi:hypothetical protein
VAGDFSVDYKITPDGRLSSKAFSKSQYDVVDERYKTKNGIALSYKREFNKLRELFQKDPEREKLKAEQKRLKEEEKRLRHEQKMRELNPETRLPPLTDCFKRSFFESSWPAFGMY